MPATQISFSDFALAAQQAATSCAPPAIDTAFDVVAHPLAVGGGGCIQPGSDCSEFDRLTALAEATAVIPLAAPCSSGGWVLMALANCYGPLYQGRRSQAELIDDLRYHAAFAIGAGC